MAAMAALWRHHLPDSPRNLSSAHRLYYSPVLPTLPCTHLLPQRLSPSPSLFLYLVDCLPGQDIMGGRGGNCAPAPAILGLWLV